MEQDPALLWKDAGQGRQGLRTKTRTQARELEFRARLFSGGNGKTGKLRLKVSYKNLIHTAGKLLPGNLGGYF